MRRDRHFYVHNLHTTHHTTQNIIHSPQYQSLSTEAKMESALTLVACCSFWIFIYFFSHAVDKKNKDHFNSRIVSNVHVLGAIILASASLYFDDESVFPERVVLSWAAGFFLADLIDCIVRKDTMFFAHAVIGLALLWSCWNSPFYVQRAGSRGYFVELSSPFYQRWVADKTKPKFGLFCLVFFLCRIVYTPIFLNKMNLFHDIAQNLFAFVACVAFYLMNCAWFAKGMQMLFNYKEKKPLREKNV